jgi:hypothetical protein
VNDWLKSNYPCKRKVLIDEVTNIIEGALAELLKAEVVACTFSIPMKEINNSEEVKK